MVAPSVAQARRVAAALLDWYRTEARPLKIRERRDAYAVLVVEVMAQQTQISRVDQLAQRFLERFPTLDALAAAERAEVIDAWRGLGYNRRAVALHDAAQQAVAGGGLPPTHEALMELPGIGPYTARAVAAITAGGRSIPVDVNIARIVQRLIGAVPPLRPRELQIAADAFGDVLEPGLAGTWAQAAMDLAARVCRRTAPDCAACPLKKSCQSAGEAFAAPARRTAATPFPATRRWLRGRILDELRDAGPAGVSITGARGVHEKAAVELALEQLVRDGLAEQLGSRRYRLPRAALKS